MEKNRLRSKLRQAKGLGSAHSGVHHWWLERITAVALIPLCVWFVISLLNAMLFPTANDVAVWLSSVFVTVAMMALILAGFVHACLGNQVVIEDYIKCPYAKYSLLILNKFTCVVLAIISILAVLNLHLRDLAASLS